MRADLFSYQDEREAEAEVEAARQARADAYARFRRAPYGEIRARTEKLRQATAEALRAELHLARVRGQA